jgi:hypothetical protein
MSATSQSPGPAGSSSGRKPPPTDSEQPQDPNPPPAEAIGEAFSRLAELKEFAAYYAAARLDAWKASARNMGIYAGLGLLALVAAAALVVTAVVLLLRGISGAFAQLFSGHPWLGDVITSVLFLLLIAAGAIIGMKLLSRWFHSNTVAKYESRQSRQRQQFGRDVRHEAQRSDGRPQS